MDAQITDLKKKVLNNPRTKTTVAGLTMVLHDALGMLERANKRIEALENTINDLAKCVKGNKKPIREAHEGNNMLTRDFDTIFTKARPHILEKISLSLDYNTFKNCLEVNEAWRTILTAKTFRKKAKSLFREEILEDVKKLMTASGNGKVEEVRKLVSIGLVDIDYVDDKHGWTPLHSAAFHGHKDVVQLLLDRGSDPNKANVGGQTPLHYAAMKGHKDVVQLLLDRGADPNKANEGGWTPLHEAAQNGHTVVLQLLLDRGADLNKANESGFTPLYTAAFAGHKYVVKLLLDRGADPDLTNDDGNTPLEMAHKDVLVDLFKRQARKRKLTAEKNNGGRIWTPKLENLDHNYCIEFCKL